MDSQTPQRLTLLSLLAICAAACATPVSAPPVNARAEASAAPAEASAVASEDNALLQSLKAGPEDADHIAAQAVEVTRVAGDENLITGDDIFEAHEKLYMPYRPDNVISTFSDCRKDGSVKHEAIDLGGIGEDAGVGTPIYAMTHSKVVLIGTPEISESKFGVYDTRAGEETRGGESIPRSATIPGYGEVFFFTIENGSWRSGVVLVTEGLEGPLYGYQIRYMHMAAIHPDIKEGDVLQPGQEIGLMGATGFLESMPHLHLDMDNPEGERIDPAFYLGLEEDDQPCPR